MTSSAVWLLCSLMASSNAEPVSQLLYFDPDANQEHIVAVSALFNKYLETTAPGTVFEPIASQDAFEKRANDPLAKFAIVSSSYLRQHKSMALNPLLVPEVSGSVYYHKLLVDNGEGAPMQLNNKTVAASVRDEEAKGVLNYLKGQSIQVDGAFVVSVTKDVDALLALTFGQADAALVTENSIEVLKQSNPNAASKFRILMRTGDFLRAPLCEVGKRVSASERASMIKVLSSLDSDESGKRLLQVLGTQRWVPFSPGMLK